jgi:tetraprenyl-beta-curcumene synthase
MARSATATASMDTAVAPSTLGDGRLVVRAGLALILANVRYWSSVAPIVRGELRRWECRAKAIEDPELRTLALEKLAGERFHAEVAAMLATLAPRCYRGDVVEAIVAVEVMYDYLDGLSEQQTSADPLGDGERLFEAYTDALAPRLEGKPEQPYWEDGGYLQALSDAASVALNHLPAAGAIANMARANAARSAQAQIRMHATPQLGTEQLEAWANGEAQGTDLGWRELLAGAGASVLAAHALIAAAADPDTTAAQAAQIESAYLSTCVVVTLLDGLVDHDRDTQAGGKDGLSYTDFYEDRKELSQTLSDATRRAARQTRALRSGPHHVMTLAGVVAYYASAPSARTEIAAPIVKRLQRELSPLIYPTLAVMHAWRLAKRVRNRRSPAIGGLASSLETNAEVEGHNEV